MPNIAVCYKWVADEADIIVNADLSVNMDRATGKISDYDKNAIEAGVQLKKALLGTLYGVTFSADSGRPSLKDALSRGLDAAVWVHGTLAADADEYVTCRAIAAGLAKLEDVGVIVCGDGSSDNYARQLPSRLGAALDIPVITAVSHFAIEDGKLLVTRKLEDDEEVYLVDLPVVISVLPEACAAPVPGLKSVMAAGKKPVIEVDADAIADRLEAKSKAVSIKGYEMKRKNIRLTGESEEDIVEQLFLALDKEGVF